MISFADTPIKEGSLTAERARQFHHFVTHGQPDVTYIGSCANPPDLPCLGFEFVIVSIRTRLPQRPIVDVHEEEQFAIGFHPFDKGYPLVLSLREDFPETLHINRTPWDLPRSLCLSDLPWSEAQLTWSPFILIQHLQRWLRNAALGELHALDQPLEPLFIQFAGDLILPSDFVDGKITSAIYSVRLLQSNATPTFQVMSDLKEQDQPKVVCLRITAPLQQHRGLAKVPLTIAALAGVLAECQVDLYGTLREMLSPYNTQQDRTKKLIIVVVVPMTRDQDGERESYEIFAAIPIQEIGEVGKAVGLWEPSPVGSTWAIAGLEPLPIDTVLINLGLLRPHLMLNTDRAASYSGRLPSSSSIVAIGAGAIGSQVIDLLSRSGYGQWTLVDHDKLLPHNVARHALPAFAVGLPKVLRLMQLIATNLSNRDSVTAHVADFCDQGDSTAAIQEALKKADLILDFSASLPVARKLASSVDATARRVSFFINPSGTDSIFIAESDDRSITLDMLEMQYYRGLCSDARLHNHLLRPVDRVQVSRSCRDHTLVIPNELVALHAAIGARAVHALAKNFEAHIHVWHAEPETMATGFFNIETSPASSVEINGWTLTVDDFVLRRLIQLRDSKLPVETGGVLIGGVDRSSKRLYVTEVIASPADSTEERNGYVRGKEGLASAVSRFGELTDGQLQYVGEWHSHPRHSSTSPSELDRELMTKLTVARAFDCFPALMAIVGDDGRSSWYFDSIDYRAEFSTSITTLQSV
ncbi:MAG: Mov34/MPN/PAD-1 family protein [Bacteroidota bacterium]|nr:Mov34/MPN/PAD-1 family protein [Bacteroidota bacterium]